MYSELTHLLADHHEADRRLVVIDRPVETASIRLFFGVSKGFHDGGDELFLSLRRA